MSTAGLSQGANASLGGEGARAPGGKRAKRAVHGVLLLDKPVGLSSNDALQRAKWLFRAEKAGHTGTLDPLATGVLPLCFGAATKFSQFALDADKAYVATLRLGVTTTTGDAEGEILETRAVQVAPEALASVLSRFCGDIAQTPPMYSALKHEGKPLYEYARRGITVERPVRQVRVNSMTGHWLDATTVHLQVSCSKGTYIRTLAEDIGQVLGCGAHLIALRRTATAGFTEAQTLSLEALTAMDEAARDACLLPPDALLAHAPRVELADAEAARFLTGLRRRTQLPDQPLVRVYGPQPKAFLGSGHVVAGELISDRLLSPIEVSQIT